MKIRIVSTPRGEAPQWVRQAWVGLALPVADNVPEDSQAVGIFSKKPLNGVSAPVNSLIALRALTQCNPRAARWWLDFCSRNPIDLFFFDRGCYELVSLEPSRTRRPS